MHDRAPDARIEHGSSAWDLPTRLFHWSIVILVGLAWWTAEEHLLDWHRRAGYAILSLLIFRILWGFFGSRISRFASFCRTPAQVLSYIRNEMFSRGGLQTSGHNPLGGWSVMAMLATMLLQTLLGLVAVDVDGIESGPLSYLVSFEIGRGAATVHHYVFDILIFLVALHISAIVFHYFYKGQDLTRRMLAGSPETENKSGQPSLATSLLPAALLIWSVFVVFFLTAVVGR